ncbi:heme biosynthesis HemY N-terminal domain-containing protein [Oceanimonas baumannii]|uniref:HemY protein n=1 Tax=Oceanimonas baumannii TaxID=129578 RepID=A0A235CIK3_9GAMM|nr:heme biosynthesis HemY N-terminal domain-containing protein [Oceanimonas baumannii]OYD24229.1 heme biosynthesis protein HemY [Oceanimonas baumannii]TDW58955.1 HemY protein [Oceanimonas baumannii]
MIRLAIIVAILAAGLIVGPGFMGKQGYVLVSAGSYTIETTVTVFLVAAVLFYVLLLFIEWLLGRIFGISHRTRGWFMGRRRRKALNYTQSGMQALVAEDYANAEKMLLKGTKGNELALLNYLNAASAAQAQGNDEKRDSYLQQAREQHPAAGLAVGITQARLQYQQGEFEQALAGVQALETTYGHQPALLKLQKDVYVATGQWQALLGILDSLANKNLISAEEKDELRHQSWLGRFEQAAHDEGSDGLIKVWQALPRKDKYNPALLLPLCDRLIGLKAHKEAQQLLLEGLDKEADPGLLLCATRLQLSDYHPLLAALEKKAKKESLPELHSALGRLYLKEGKDEQAEQHLQQAVAQKPEPRDYVLLAELAERRKDLDKANDYYKHSLALATI